MPTVLWVNGEFRSPDEPAVSALDRGLLLGYGVFETLAVEGGVAFALTRHLLRLENSARIIGLKLPDLAWIRRGITAVCDQWRSVAQGARGRMRVTVTGGPGPLGLPADEAAPSVLIAVSSAPAARQLGSDRGIRAAVSPWRINPDSPLQGAKTLSYAAHAVLQRYAREHGADEILSATVDGQLCEGATSNVFVEVGAEMLTPPLSAGCLPGITRELILEWASQEGLPVREARDGELPLEVLETADHLAVTGSVRGIMPITSMGSRDLRPGPLTEEVARVFQRNAALLGDP